MSRLFDASLVSGVPQGGSSAAAGPTGSDELVAESLSAAAVTLARRFAAGATLWCVAPEWPSHAWHVAVEFVHPAVVGKHPLPAAHLDEEDICAAMRLLSHAGDVVLVVSSAGDQRAREVLRRSPAWGLTRVWLGAGPRPPADAAEHIVWWDELDPAVAARSGDVVLLYHLLWELSHAVLEHPGLLATAPGPACSEEVCITCSDEGRVAEVRALHDDGRAEVVVEGKRESVDASLVEAAPGDLVLVHAGVVVALLGPPQGGAGA